MTSRGLRFLGLSLAAALVSFASPAWSSSVDEVRVGRHATFTRVVFQLDSPAGYRVERHVGGDTPEEIIVTLDAVSAPRTIKTDSVLIESVSIEPNESGTVARIALRKPGLRLKEMILGRPARIVLDVLVDESMLAAAEAPAPKPAVVAQPAPAPKPAVVAQPAPAPKPAIVAQPAPAPKPAIVAQPTPAPKPAIVAQPAPAPRPEPMSAVIASPEPAPKPEATLAAEIPSRASRPVPAARPPASPVARPSPPRSPVAPAARPEPSKPPAVVEKSEPIDWGIVAAVVGGLLLVGGGIFFVLRRRALPRDVEVDGFGDEEAFEDRIPAGGFAMDSALGIGGEAEAEEDWTVTAAQPLPAPGADREIPLPEFDVATAPAEASEDAEKESVMDQELQDLPMNRSAMPPPSASMNSSAASSDVSGIVSALERRMSQLEKRLDESNEARERLERQVAAQSEELRVQRAAIARTQRALRSLSRTEEEQATEPALRDPSRPPAPRGPSA